MDEKHDLFGWVGATIDGKYRVDEVVGIGGFGIVYRAHHLGFDQTVALKCLRLPQTLSGTERDRFRETFLGEGRLLHQLSRATAGIVQALDLGAAVSPNKHWTPYLVLEWLDGVPLDRDFAERRAGNVPPRAVDEAIELLGSAARALGVAHAQGVAHRDIKPANLFIAKVGARSVVKVLDFGIAKVMAESESVTRAFEETGGALQAFTARYGAPEQFSRRYGATGPWTDVFALALVFVEAVTGRQALDGTDAAQLFVAAADTERRPTVRGLGHAATDPVEAVLARALAVDPRARFATASDFWDALETAAGVISSASSAVGRGSFAALGNVGDANLDWLRVSGNAPTAAEPIASSATEMSSASQIPGSTRAPKATRLSFGRVLAGGAALLITAGSLSIAVGLFTSRQHSASTAATDESATAPAEPSNTPVPAAAALDTANAEPAPAENATASSPPTAVPSAASAPSAVPPSALVASAASTALAAPSAAPSARPALFAGVPARDVPAGAVGPATIGGYRLLARDAGVGLDFYGASKQCTEVGMTLCTESQWVHACASFPELGSVSSWTSSIDGEQVVVRGGGTCTSEGRAAPVERGLNRFGMCCERAIAMTSDNLQKQYLNTTAERVLAVERALNQRNVQAFLDLSDPTVVVDDQTKTQSQLRTLIESGFRSAPELIVLNDECKFSVQAKKITKQLRHRKKQVTYQTQGWTADCQQTAIVPGNVTRQDVEYSFTAQSKLREITTRPADEGSPGK